ncbi:MAG: 6-pyruvoyl trahydropterin synthase family protein [Candidatus Thorarchaeota archaeon]|jgi:6-pyruvoyltetrahydropterin/6-carboxytetrahydropterin synthase
MHSIHVTDKRMHFSAAHFVMGASKCENLHGHNYTVEVYVNGPLDGHGMVIDFRDVKEQVLKVCKTLDHKVLLPGTSEVIKVRDLDDAIEVRVEAKRYVLPKSDCLVLPIVATTAELLAEFICCKLEFPDGFRFRVCVDEAIGSTGCFERE